MASRSTCAQVLLAIRQGLFDLFKEETGPRARIHINDCDEDVCLSWFLLKNHRLIKEDLPFPISRLVAIEDLMDATAGAYPLPIKVSSLEDIAWIFAPYRNFRISGGLDRKIADEYLDVINQVESRIFQFIEGKGQSVELDTRYTKIGGGPEWVMIEETGAHAQTGVYIDGIRAYVSMRQRPDGRYTYTIGRMTPYIDFDIYKLIRALNKSEGKKRDRWGGSTTVGGSPRVYGSKLQPGEVEEIINKNL